MRRFISVICGVCFVVLLAEQLLLPSLGIAADSWKKSERKSKAKFQAWLDTIRASYGQANNCSVGLDLSEEGVVFGVSSYAGTLGIRKGDRLTAYDGQQWVSLGSLREYWKGLEAGEEITLLIERDGESLEVSATCLDNREYFNKIERVISYGAAGNFEKCASEVRIIERDPLGRPDSSYAAWIRVNCLEGADFKAKREAGPSTASALYEYGRRLLDAGRYSEQAREANRFDVLSAVTYLEGVDRHDLARDLRDQMDVKIEPVLAESPTPEQPSVQVGYGTCFVVGPTGQILTADHVVSGANQVRVRIDGGDFMKAEVEMASPFNDLALLHVDASTSLYMPLAEIRSAETGQQVFTMGFPVTTILGEEPKFTEGSISATSGPGGEASLLQISVPVQPGNSGGPLVSFTGEVVGIITSSAAIVPFIKASGTLPQNVNWAVSADYARPMFTPPPAMVPAQSREEAIERTKKALCQVEATKH